MRAFAGLSVALSLALSLSAPAAADSHGFSARSHARRHVGASAIEDRTLNKRFDGSRFTYYADGLGACGKTNAPGDFIVALNAAQYSGGSHCFESITITANGKTTSATIVDECPGCAFGDLDLSEGLFKFFAPESVGVLSGSWSFGSGDPAPKPSTSTPPPPPPSTTHTTTSTPPPPPSTTSKHSTTTTSTPPPTTSTTPPPTTSSKPTSSAQSTTSAAPTSAAPPVVNDPAVINAGLVANAGQSNMYQSNLAVVQLARIIDAALN